MPFLVKFHLVLRPETFWRLVKAWLSEMVSLKWLLNYQRQNSPMKKGISNGEPYIDFGSEILNGRILTTTSL